VKTLYQYITGQVLAALALTVAVFAFVVLLLNVLKEVLPLLMSGHVPLLLTAKAIGLLLPFACVYALPMGFITATLLVFGRFSADQELTAMRASGVSLLSLITPVLLLSLLCCGLSAWFNMDLGPRSRAEFVNLRDGALQQIAAVDLLPEGQMVYAVPGYMFYVGKNHGGNLEDVNIYRLQSQTNWDTLIHAARGKARVDRAANQLWLELNDCRSLTPSEGEIGASSVMSTRFDLPSSTATNQNSKPKISDMTFRQLQEELRYLQAMKLTPTVNPTNSHISFKVPGNMTPAQVTAMFAEFKRNRDDQIARVHVTMHREVAASFACFGFTLVGIPLGIRVHRRETNIGIATALMLVMVYYAFVMLGQSLSARPEFYPHLILWLPNFLFQAVGGILLWRANRGI